jgi:heme exporter protein A
LCWSGREIAMMLSATNLALKRGHRVLLRDFALTLTSGEGLCIRGPNGSGKTTLLRTLAGLHEPLAGTFSAHLDPDEPPQVSFLGHQDPIKAGQPLMDQLQFWAMLAGKPKSRAQEVLDQVGLTRQAGLQGGVLSAGQRRRASLARLLIEDRPIWLLDEPAAPLDTDGRTILGKVLGQHLKNNGMFVAAVHDDLPGPVTQTIWLELT